MDMKSFRKLCSALVDLTGPQLKELRIALRSLDARMQLIGAIERRREDAVACPHCNQDQFGSLGLDADRGPADAVCILQADLFVDNRHGGGGYPFASRFPSGRPRYVF
jgi:hypothetical protein